MKNRHTTTFIMDVISLNIICVIFSSLYLTKTLVKYEKLIRDNIPSHFNNTPFAYFVSNVFINMKQFIDVITI